MGTLTIATDPTQDARITTAFGARLSLGRDATASEVKEEVINMIRKVVVNHEREVAAQTAIDGVPDITPI